MRCGGAFVDDVTPNAMLLYGSGVGRVLLRSKVELEHFSFHNCQKEKLGRASNKVSILIDKL